LYKNREGNLMLIAVCDDEKETRELLAEKIRMIFQTADISLYPSGNALLIADRKPDILLLDIQMPYKNGMETARELRKKWKDTILIFVTALEDYVFQAFDVGAFHYLVKPVEDRKLEEVLKNAVKQLEEGRQKAADKKADTEAQSLIINTKGRHFVVKLEDIVYAEIYNRKIILHTLDADIEYYGKIKELEEKAGGGFYRPHRAYLVNFHYIRKYDATTIYLEKGQARMAKQNYQDFVKSYLRYNQRKEKGYD